MGGYGQKCEKMPKSLHLTPQLAGSVQIIPAALTTFQ
jgi:hypothetical protein